MWKLKGVPITIRATKKLAEEFKDMEAVPQDRPLSEKRLQVYERVLQQKQFRPCTWARAYCIETGVLYRINGKHTATLLSGIPEDSFPEFYVVIEDYECDTLHDAAQLYSTYDSRMQSRTTSDVNLSFAGTVPELVGIPARVINACVGALAYHTYFIAPVEPDYQSFRREQPADKAERMLENSDFVKWMSDFGVNANRHLLRVAVIAAMLSTRDKNRSKSEAFWTAVRDETGPAPNLPDRVLAKYLASQDASKAIASGILGYREVYVKCIHAWNAWRRGESTILRYHKDAGLPAVVK